LISTTTDGTETVIVGKDAAGSNNGNYASATLDPGTLAGLVKVSNTVSIINEMIH